MVHDGILKVFGADPDLRQKVSEGNLGVLKNDGQVTMSKRGGSMSHQRVPKESIRIKYDMRNLFFIHATHFPCDLWIC